jgi:hypothetical protein
MPGTRKNGKSKAGTGAIYTLSGIINCTGIAWSFMLGKTTIMWYKSRFYDKSHDEEI